MEHSKKNNFQNHIANALVKIVVNCKISKKTLAEQLNVSAPYLTQITSQNSKKIITPEMLRKIITLLREKDYAVNSRIEIEIEEIVNKFSSINYKILYYVHKANENFADFDSLLKEIAASTKPIKKPKRG